MHYIEPFYLWRHIYNASEDEQSPFFEREYSEFTFTNTVYNHLIHPQWDDFGSETLYIKILFADYEEGFAVIEMMGEWNDCLYNDIMTLKREVLELLMAEGINKFIMIGENVLNFHADDDSYYEEWSDELEEGWVVFVNFLPHVLSEFKNNRLDYYVNFGGKFDDLEWRKISPMQLFGQVNEWMEKRLV